MTTICISGHCCSGKSMAIEIMGKHLQNSAIVRSDSLLAAALLYYRKEFKEIYGMSLDVKNPYESLRYVLNDSSEESIRAYRRLLGVLAPFLENELEKAFEKAKHGNDFMLVEYVMLPVFKMWINADYRIMISSNSELRAMKWRERAIAKGSYSEGDCHHYTRENALLEIIENAGNIDFTIENKYDENFEIDLVRLCKELAID